MKKLETKIAMTKRGDNWVQKIKASVLTTFPQYSIKIDSVDMVNIKNAMSSIIDNPVGTGQTVCVVRVLAESGEGKLFEFSGIKR